MKLWHQNIDLKIYHDWRGSIKNLLPEGVAVHSIMYISGHPGAVRGSHTHKKDTHYCYVLSGKIEYSWRDADNVTHEMVLLPGHCVLSEVGELHKFTFLSEGVFIAMATEPRTQASYEDDTKRENF